MKKVLILGGYGFLGQNLNEIFDSDENYLIKNVSRRTGVDLLDYYTTKVTIHDFDPDIIINAAAHVGSMKYVSEHAAEVINDNVQMSLNIYRSLVELEKEVLVINPLSNCSYPGIIDIQHEELYWDGEIHETVMPYGMSKKLLYCISKSYATQYPHIKSITLLVPNAYGVFDHLSTERTHALTGMIIRMLQAQKINDPQFKVWGSGAPVREWIFMEDVALIIKEILDKNLELPDIINLGREEGFSIKDTALTIKELIGYKGDIVFDTTYADGAPIKILGSKLFKEYFPDFKFQEYKEGINETINYYKLVFDF
jgi:GDP-L-fucose synthase